MQRKGAGLVPCAETHKNMSHLRENNTERKERYKLCNMLVQTKILETASFSNTHVCQHSQMILATKGSTSFGMSRRRSWKPTAPTTCIGFMPCQGILRVASSHKMTPKLYTSHLYKPQNGTIQVRRQSRYH